MSDFAHQPKTTPARQRQARGARGRAQRGYASENDAANASVSHFGSPQTPEKNLPRPQAFTGSVSGHGNHRQGNKSKPKPKHQSTSPRPSQQTTPHRAVSVKTAPAPAFAGATFHASPAPASLPIPSFLSKLSSPSPKAPDDVPQQPTPPATDIGVPTPRRSSNQPQSNESPLDFMFRAHRAEQQQQQRGDSSTDLRKDAPYTKSHTWASSLGSSGPSRQPSASRSTQPILRRPSNGIGSAELDGTPGRPLGPAFSTPYQERIKAARTGSGYIRTTSPMQDSTICPDRQDPSEALKKFLFGGRGSANTASSGNVVTDDHSFGIVPSAQPQPRFEWQGKSRSNNIQAMENDLRRILKMDTAPEKATSQ